MKPNERTSGLMVLLLVLYESMILFLLTAAVIPQGVPFLEFWQSPIRYMQIDQIAVALAIALFLPLVYRKIDTLKIGSTEVKLHSEVKEVKNDIKQVKQNLSDQRYDYDRALFAIISRLNRQLESGPRRNREAAEKTALQIGALDFAESWLTTEIVYRHLLAKSIEVKPPDTRETTLMTFFNLLSGKIDLFLWYSGTGMAMSGMGVVPHDEDSGRTMLNELYKQWGLEWLPCIGFENREGPVMLRETADRFGISTMSQLAEQSGNLVFGANREYFLRSWAYPRLKRKKMVFGGFKEIDINDRLSGLFNKDFDVGVIYGTDPEIRDHRLKPIQWDEPEFVPISQFAMPLCRIEHADRLGKALEGLTISEDRMIRMKNEAKRRNFDDMAIRGIADNFFR